MNDTQYTLTFYREDSKATTSGFTQVATDNRNVAIDAWAKIMVEDTLRLEGDPLYNVFIHVNGVAAFRATTGDWEDESPLDEWQYKDDINQIMLMASVEHDRILKHQRDDQWRNSRKPGPVPGPGRRK